MNGARVENVSLPILGDEMFAQFKHLISKHAVLIVEGQLRYDDFLNGWRVTAKRVRSAYELIEEQARRLTIPWSGSLGSFVRDQVEALRGLDEPDLELEVFAFTDGAYLDAARALRREHGGERFDVVHAHFGLTAWPALAARARARVVQLHGTDVRHKRSRRITQAAFPFQDLVAVVSENLERALPPGARTVAVLPCGVAPRFRPIDRATARRCH